MKIIYYTLILYTQLFICTANAQVWMNLNCPQSGSKYSIILTKYGTILASSSGYIVRSTNQGNSWITVQNLGYDITSLSKNDSLGIIYAGRDINSSHQYGGVYRSTNDGMTWGFCGLSSYKINSIITTKNGFVFTASSSGEVNMGGVRKSTDNGNSWTISLSSLYDVACLWVDKLDNIYAGTEDIGSSGWGQVLKSTNYGIDWSIIGWYSNWGRVKGGVTDTLLNIYCVPGGGQVYKTINNGINWTLIFNLYGGGFYTVPFVVNRLNYLFIGDLGTGIFRSTNYGLNWENYSDGLSNNMVYCLYMDNNGYLYAGCGFQIFRTIYSTCTKLENISSKIPKNFILEQNHPNPFNAFTMIKFHLKKSEFVILEIFDILGNKLNSLVNKDLTEGNHSIILDGSYYDSGIYFYRLNVGEFSETKKMIIIK